MILIVDDEPEIRRMIKEILKNEGVDSITASNSEEAIENFKHSNFQVVILDIGMPGKNGLELSKELKRMDPNVTIICLSGYVKILEFDLIKADIKFLLEKPFTKEGLVNMVKEALA